MFANIFCTRPTKYAQFKFTTTPHVLKPSLLYFVKHILPHYKVWATEGDGFCSIYYKPLNRKLGFGICMDINPYEFEAPFHAYEFATFHKEQGSDIIIFSSAWTDSEEDSDDPFSTINYWAARLNPLMEPGGKKCLFLCSDRIGRENDTTYVGCSCAISLGDRKLLGNLGKRDESVLVVRID